MSVSDQKSIQHLSAVTHTHPTDEDVKTSITVALMWPSPRVGAKNELPAYNIQLIGQYANYNAGQFLVWRSCTEEACLMDYQVAVGAPASRHHHHRLPIMINECSAAPTPPRRWRPHRNEGYSNFPTSFHGIDH
ncbi:hypothetical protein FPOAC2_13445 [Fusarium poae]|jgi:hypothetical protein